MNKELIVTLLQKDITELAKLTESFEELDFYPSALLELAQTKAEKIVENIAALRTTNAQLTKEIKSQPAQPIVEKTAAEQPVLQPEIVKKEQPQVVKTEEKVVVPERQPKEEPTPAPQPEQTEEMPEQKSIIEEQIEANCAEEEIVVEEDVKTEKVEECVADEETDEEDTPQTPIVVPEKAVEKPTETSKILAETIVPQTITRNDSLQNQKVDDIKHAISLGDRFLFQRELFGGNGELMSKTITAINNCKTFEEAQQLIAKKIDLDMENPAAVHFMHIISRRF